MNFLAAIVLLATVITVTVSHLPVVHDPLIIHGATMDDLYPKTYNPQPTGTIDDLMNATSISLAE